MKRPLCIDLFCGAGGAAMGLYRAGFDLEGWDINPQPNYPFKFNQGNALEADLNSADLVWASPPCQAYTMATISHRKAGKVYPDLMAETRDKLVKSQKPYIIENTPGAPMRVNIILCGSMFGLNVIRHRWFEYSFNCFLMVNPCQHPENPCCVVGHGTTSWARAKNGGKCHTIKEARKAMGIDWMTRQELSLAVPPAYSEYLGRAAMEALGITT
jgi:DNA (cytosine-5)-methyltransferase 1